MLSKIFGTPKEKPKPKKLKFRVKGFTDEVLEPVVCSLCGWFELYSIV